MEDFLQLITEVLEIEDRTITAEDHFKQFDEWDSLARLSLIASIDDQYNVIIDDQTFTKLETLQQLYDEIQGRI
ncbi:acyl carrier protein [Flavobacterium aurantiibacter]|nr:acyl carrier protein [Flavobacterium aurantiibacter]